MCVLFHSGFRVSGGRGLMDGRGDLRPVNHSITNMTEETHTHTQ